MSGPPPPPPPPPPWRGFQNEHYSVPPPPGVSSAPLALPKPSFAWSLTHGQFTQMPSTHSPGVVAGVYPQHAHMQHTFTTTNESPHSWPLMPNIQSPGVVNLQQTLASQGFTSGHGAPQSIGNGAQNISYAATGCVAHNIPVSHFSSNMPGVHNPFSIPQPLPHGKDGFQLNKVDKIDVKDLISNLRGLIAQANESVGKILSMVKIRPEALPLKSLDPRAVGSTGSQLAPHTDSVIYQASHENLQRSDDFTTASTIFNNILISSRKFRDNIFYTDAPGVVQVPVHTVDESSESLKLPDFASGERWDELTPQSLGSERQAQGTLLPSTYWLASKEIVEWKDLPMQLTSSQLKAVAGLALVQQADLKKWLLTHGRSYGVACSRSLADHIVILLVFCLRAVYREATSLLDSREKVGLVDSKVLPQSASWLSAQLSSLCDAAASKNLVLDLYKYALKTAAYCSIRSLHRGSLEDLQKKLSLKAYHDKIIGAGLEQEPCNPPSSSSEDVSDQNNGSSRVGDGVLCLQHLSAAILVIHAQAAHDKCRASDLLNFSPYQRSAVHSTVINRAAEVRATRVDYRAVLEHDGLIWQRTHNQDSKTNKTKEELLAEERDYKRRRMSYRGKKVQRTPAEVLRDIIEGHMEDIITAGGIGCIGRRIQDVQLPQTETTLSALGAKDHTDTCQKSRSSSRDTSKELRVSNFDRNRYSRSESRDLLRTEMVARHGSNSMSLSSSSQRHDQTYQERPERLSHDHSGGISSERKYEPFRDYSSRWESKGHGERHHSSKHQSRARE